MRITHLGHACLLVESGATRLLIDPGTFSSGFEHLTGLEAVLATHRHDDHLDPGRLPALLAVNPGARLVFEPDTAAATEDLATAEVVAAGSRLRFADIEVEVVGAEHARNHDQIPPLGNVGYLLRSEDTTVFHPGDSYADTPSDVDVLAIPLNAPWARMRETLAFARAVNPRLMIPIHDGLLNDTGRAVYLMHLESFGPDQTAVHVLTDGTALNV